MKELPFDCETCTLPECLGPFSQSQCSWENIGRSTNTTDGEQWKKERNKRHSDNLAHLTGKYKGNFYTNGRIHK